jgi:hypothetical protein
VGWKLRGQPDTFDLAEIDDVLPCVFERHQWVGFQTPRFIMAIKSLDGTYVVYHFIMWGDPYGLRFDTWDEARFALYYMLEWVSRVLDNPCQSLCREIVGNAQILLEEKLGRRLRAEYTW